MSSADYKKNINNIASEIQRAVILTMAFRSGVALLMVFTMIPIILLAAITVRIGKRFGLAIASTLEIIIIRKYSASIRNIADTAHLESLSV